MYNPEPERLKTARDFANRILKQAEISLTKARVDLEKVREINQPAVDFWYGENGRLFDLTKEYTEKAKEAYTQNKGTEVYANNAIRDSIKIILPHIKEERHRLINIIDSAKEEFRLAELNYERCLSEFNTAEENYVKCLGAIDQAIKDENQKLIDLGKKFGLPDEHVNNLKITTAPNGVINFLFGGIGKPDGHGHGHIVIGKNGNLIHYRPVRSANS